MTRFSIALEERALIATTSSPADHADAVAGPLLDARSGCYASVAVHVGKRRQRLDDDQALGLCAQRFDNALACDYMQSTLGAQLSGQPKEVRTSLIKIALGGKALATL